MAVQAMCLILISLPVLKATRCSVDLTYMDCRNRRLTEIPAGDKEALSITSLDLANNHITSCPVGSFYQYNSLMRLDLSHNLLSQLDKDCFQGLVWLKELDLSFNNFSTFSSFPAGVFDALGQLRSLKISLDAFHDNCRNEQLKGRLFYNLKQLQKLYVHGVLLNKIPREFSHLSNLQELYWKIGCEDADFNSTFLEHLSTTKLTTLSVVGSGQNSITGVHGDLSTFLPHLKKFNLACNYYLHIPSTVQWLKSWKYRNISHLNMDVFHSGSSTQIDADLFCNLSNTVSLSMRNSGINDVDLRFVECLPNLKYIAFAANIPPHKIVIPNEYLAGNYPSIEIADLSFLGSAQSTNFYCDNKLDSFEDWFWKPPSLPEVSENVSSVDTVPSLSLKYVKLDNTQVVDTKYNKPLHFTYRNTILHLGLHNTGIQDLQYPIYDLTKLQMIDLSANSIQGIASNVLKQFPNLRFLNLSSNRLGAMGNGLHTAFSDCKNLLDVDLSGNNMYTIDAMLLRKLRNVVRLSLARNKLTNLDIDFGSMKNLRYLSVAHNKLPNINKGTLGRLVVLQSNVKVLNLTQEYQDLLNYRHSFVEINIQENPFLCICENADFFTWIQNAKLTLTNKPNLNCLDSSNNQRIIVELHVQGLCSSYFLLVFVSSLSVCTLVGLVVLGYTFRWSIRWRLHRLRRSVRLKRYPTEDEGFTYDGFIMFALEDLGWVRNEILPRVEDQWGFQMCVSERDWLAGTIADCAIESIKCSRKVIWLVTKNFVRSRWVDFEINMTLVEKSRRDIIVLYIEDIADYPYLSKTLSGILRLQLYYEWTDDQDGQKLFWDKLHKSLKKG